MFATRLHRPTAIYLAALYGVVGITGESLHYLATASFLWKNAPSADVLVYYHTHGPDYHGHFHRHAHHHHSDHSHAPPATTHESDEHSAALAPEAIAHEPHACPLLSLVSTLKLSSVGTCEIVSINPALVMPVFERDRVAECAGEFASSARGPPASIVA